MNLKNQVDELREVNEEMMERAKEKEKIVEELEDRVYGLRREL